MSNNKQKQNPMATDVQRNRSGPQNKTKGGKFRHISAKVDTRWTFDSAGVVDLGKAKAKPSPPQAGRFPPIHGHIERTLNGKAKIQKLIDGTYGRQWHEEANARRAKNVPATVSDKNPIY